MEAAGAKIRHFESFGSYQGEWLALVEYKGMTGWVVGSYGSCSGCDAFEAEIGYERGECDTHAYEAPHPECELCKQKQKEYTVKLAAFGLRYLSNIMTAKEALAACADSWSSSPDEVGDNELTTFIKARS
jgi:hypothetical protein